MEAVFSERKEHRGTSHDDDSKTNSRIITRKQSKRGQNPYKSKEEESPVKNKRSHSTHQFKFLKNTQNNQPQEHSTTPQMPQNTPFFMHNKRDNLVFNKFTRQQRQQVREHISTIHSFFSSPNSFPPKETLSFIQAYISKLQQNNSKLLQVNYFFQKEFNQIMTQKQLSKRTQKCIRSNCMECRYHLQKESNWNQQKLSLLTQITKLKQEITSAKTSRNNPSKNESIMEQFSPKSQPEFNCTVLKLQQEIEQKEEEYLILLKEFNYLDTANKDIKKKMASLMEQYRYISIQNRTLLNLKAKFIEKTQECTKYKDERDYFKKKVIEYHKAIEKKINQPCQCNKHASSIFSLSSVSNQPNQFAPSQPTQQY